MRAIFIMLCAGLLFSCNNSKTSAFHHTPSDTIRTPVLFYSPDVKDYKLEVVYRVGLDSLTFVDVDSSTKKKSWSRQHLYYAGRADTLRDAAGNPKKDSVGKQLFTMNYYFVPNLFVKKDMDINIDSLINTEKKK